MNAIKNFIYYALGISLFCIACNNQNTSGSQLTEDSAIVAASPQTTGNRPGQTTCYKYVSGKDSVRIQLTITGKDVTGKLVYSLFEKDKNTGTLVGQLQGDTIFADYTFLSEGNTSVREIALLKRGKELIEGYGPVAPMGDKMVFVNRDSLSFTGKMVLQETPCLIEK